MIIKINRGSGGGTSGRAMAFCLGRPGSNPGLDFGFFQFKIAVNLFSLGVGLFLIRCNRTVHSLPSSFLFTIVKIINCKLTMYQEKGKINPKRGQERPILKKTIKKLHNIEPCGQLSEVEMIDCRESKNNLLENYFQINNHLNRSHRMRSLFGLNSVH